METFKCKICEMETDGFPFLHRHLKKDHGLVPKEYYPLFFDRRDKFDNELILFKDIKQYFSTDFNSKYNFLKWISLNNEETKSYCIEILKSRAAEKNVSIIPSHVELKSLFMPNLLDFISMFSTFPKFCEILNANGLAPKLQTTMPNLKDSEMKIFIDTREQSPLPFANSQIRKLIVGDYAPDESFFCNLFVERKSIFDLAGTLTKGIERFRKEVERAKELGCYLVVVTESSFLDTFEYSPKNSFSQKIGGPYLLNKIRKFMTEFDNIQFVFCQNRKRSQEIIEKIFRMGEGAKTADLEYLKDLGKL